MMNAHATPGSRSRLARRGRRALALAALLAASVVPSAHAEDAPPAPPQRKPDAGAPAKPDAREGDKPTGNPECVHVRTEARYIPYGYDHIVEVENGCEKVVRCTIATDVNSAASNLTVPPGQKRSVTTFRGSPAREFKADVDCKEED